MRWGRAAKGAATVVAVVAVAVVVVRISRRLGQQQRRDQRPRGERVTAGEREAAWSAAAALDLATRRLAELAEARADLERVADRTAELEEKVAASEARLEAARRLVADHTAVANENLRLRGAVDALTAAVAAAGETHPGGSTTAELEDEIESLRAELEGMEAQIKDLADERDRVAEEAARLREALEAASVDGDENALRRVRLELDHVRRSLDLERERNLRLGRRRHLD